MNIQKLLLIIFFILFISPSFAQNIDSLKNTLDKTTNKEAKNELLNELATAYYKQGISYYFSAEYDSAIISLKNSQTVYKELNNTKKVGELYDKIGSCYYSGKADYQQAMSSYLKALEIREQINDTLGIAYSLNNLGNIYFRLGNREKALNNYLKALVFAQKTTDKKINAILLNNIGIEYADQKEYEKAIEYHLKAVEIKKEFKNKLSLSVTYISIGSLYKYQNKLDEALEYYYKANIILETSENTHYKAMVLNYMAAVFHEKNQFQKAINYLNSSLELSEKISANKLSENSYLELTKIYKDIKNYEKAFIFQEKYIATHDTIFSEESNKALSEMQVKYETEKKEKENEILKRENEIGELKFEKQKTRAFILTITSVLLFVLIALTVILSILIYNKYRYKQKINTILEDKNDQLKLANKKLAESEQNLKELVATKDKFFSIIAHDLRSPLSSLSLVTEVLDQNIDSLDKDKTAYLLGSINKAANNLMELVENLLNWARTQTGKITFEPSKINVSEIIKQNINLLALNAEKKNITIKNNVKNNIFARADINLIATVILNLLSNAIKFTNEQGTITFDISEKNEFYEIKISDTGLGISEKNIQKLFRIDIDTRQIGDSVEKGTGLGLILCKEFVEKNGGQINVQSEIEIGSTFSFTIKKYE